MESLPGLLQAIVGKPWMKTKQLVINLAAESIAFGGIPDTSTPLSVLKNVSSQHRNTRDAMVNTEAPRTRPLQA